MWNSAMQMLLQESEASNFVFFNVKLAMQMWNSTTHMLKFHSFHQLSLSAGFLYWGLRRCGDFNDNRDWRRNWRLMADNDSLTGSGDEDGSSDTEFYSEFATSGTTCSKATSFYSQKKKEKYVACLFRICCCFWFGFTIVSDLIKKDCCCWWRRTWGWRWRRTKTGVIVDEERKEKKGT